jgi:hypothetical protein
LLNFEICSWIWHSALAEAGVTPSKLSQRNSTDNGSEGQGDVYFSPERYDLLNGFVHQKKKGMICAPLFLMFLNFLST